MHPDIDHLSSTAGFTGDRSSSPVPWCRNGEMVAMIPWVPNGPMVPNGYGEASSSLMSCAAICRPK